ncbi:MAG TPA: hypothetical protein VGP93_17060, partial [Polyangiaceae bacterium]|nr:hypothetical protein [Polyangiaceae bacterium]
QSEFGAFALDFWAPLALSDDSAADSALMLTDNIHPNAAGHAALFDVVVAADIPPLALSP